MDANSTVFRHWEDVVFENRNKNYGAYLLRRAYANRVLAGSGATILFVSLILSLQNIYSKREVREGFVPPLTGPGIILHPPPSLEAKPPKHVVRQPRQSHNTNRTVMVTRDEVIEEEQLEDIEGYVLEEGFGSGDIGTPEGTGHLALPGPEPAVTPTVVDFAEVMPQYDGGLEAMMKFIQKKIRYPRAPRQMGIEGTVYVRFVVTGDGSVSDVQVLKGFHPDCDREAVRVIAMLPAWKGGSHNGRPVSVRMVLPIRFSLK